MMKITKALMIVLAVSLCSVAVHAQDDCSTAISIPCGGSAVLDVGADANPTAVGSPACFPHACAPFDVFCDTDQDCIDAGSSDPRCILGNADVWATFVATDVSARIRTDLAGSVGTDSEYTVYSVDQTNICDQTMWTEIGCSGDEAGALGDISVGGLTVGDTYLIQLGSWLGQANAPYEIGIECPTVGTVCGDGIISFLGDEECDGAATGACLLTCEPDCTCTPVPTPMLPKWGLIGLAMMLLVGGVAVFGRGRMGAVQA